MTFTNAEARPDPGASSPASRQVAWFEVYAYAERLAAGNDLDLLDHNLLVPGTPLWCGMPDSDARKLLALVLGGVREALNHDVAQGQRADASHEISSAADWAAIARRLRAGHGNAYIPRKAAS